MYKRSGKLIYVMAGLRLADAYNNGQCKSKRLSSCDPCGTGDSASRPYMPRNSRWQRVTGGGACVSSTTLDAGTEATIKAAIKAASADTNLHVIDIDLKAAVLATIPAEGGSATGTCAASAAFGASVALDGTCYTHVHPHLFSVVDATYWNEDHSGNNGLFKPIEAFAETGQTLAAQTTLAFPASHPMSRWDDTFSSLYLIWTLGRLDDKVDFKKLPVETQDVELAKLFDAVSEASSDPTHMACGSPGEVANDPSLAHKFGIKLVYTSKSTTAGKYYNYADPHNTATKRTVATMLALTSDDQLRQRVAWALSQIFVISEIGDLDVKTGQAEVWLAFFDIFVRHGLGSFHSILKEVAYSPMMGTMLTFINSKSYAVSSTPPDENFAREIMQLFSIGLWKLNQDGSPMRDPATGARIPTYTNKNIQSFARVWTGFSMQNFRGNIEAHRGVRSTNYVDPMRLTGTNHDVLPKLGLDDEYLGDGVQVCADIPAFSFLRKGARYINVGTTLPHDGSIPGDLDPTKSAYKCKWS